MASYTVNKAAVAFVRELIDKKRYVLDSDWASEWRHKEVELAAHNLLQHLDKVSG